EVAQVFEALECEGRQGLEAEGVDGTRIGFRRELGMRYLGQSWELAVPVGDGVDSMKAAEAAFRAAHEQRYGHASDDPAEIVTVRVTAVGRMDKPVIPDPPGAAGAPAGRSRPVWFDGGYRDTAVYPRAALGAGTLLSGPVLVEEMGSVTVVPPGWSLAAGARGAFHLRRERTSGAQI
ncbi:MAG TPA: hydantoinase/oxoprolinase family protein, partial [Gammaproteobacteria bacterium]